MKKKIFNAIFTLAIAAIVALNVHVVTSEQTPAFLKWDVVGKILADGTSGSGSGLANLCCPIWDVTIEIYWYGTKIICSTGGVYKCQDCTCPS